MQYIKNREILWLYSATYNNLWWCFDEINSNQLDLIYKDYTERNNNVDAQDIKNVGIIEKVINDNIHEIKNPTFNEVNFFEVEDDEAKAKNCLENKIINYTIMAGQHKLYIDFDHWQQINYTNNMKRRIKLMRLPKNIKDEDYKEYLTDNCIKGISGIIFEEL